MMNVTVPLHFINLDQRTDRRAFFEDQCRRLGLSTVRIAAVTPDDLSAHDREILRRGTKGRIVRPVEIACIQSHIRAWRHCLAGPASFGVFFEDDALLSDSLPDFLNDYAAADGWGYDLIRLDHARRVRVLPARTVTPHEIAIREFRSTLSGAAGYILSRKGAERLLSYPHWGDTQFDLALYDPFRAPGNLVSRAMLDPALVVQLASQGETRENHGLGQSDIDPPKIAKTEALGSSSLPPRASLEAVFNQICNLADHLYHLPKGLAKSRIYFKGDTPHASQNTLDLSGEQH